jgi:hypothetical protein
MGVLFCGSIACKQFSWDPSAAAREIAAALARDATIRELEQGTLSNERSDALDKLAQQLIEDISNAFRDDSPPGKALAVEPADAAGAPAPEQKAIAALEWTLKEVCSDAKPVLSLHWFLSKFGPRLAGLTAFSRLRVRWESRFRAAQALREQVENLRRKKPEPDEWEEPSRRVRVVPSSAVLSRPVAIGSYILAMAIGTVGLGLIVAGGLTRQLAPIIAGGVVAIWAGLVMVLSTGWVMCPRNRPGRSRGEESRAICPGY